MGRLKRLINITIVYNSITKSNRLLEQFEMVLMDRKMNIVKHDMSDESIPLYVHFNQIKETKADIYLIINAASFELRTESDDWSLNHIHGLKVLLFTNDKMEIIPSPQKVDDDREQLAQLVYDVRHLKDNTDLTNEISIIFDNMIKEAELN